MCIYIYTFHFDNTMSPDKGDIEVQLPLATIQKPSITRLIL